MAVFSKMIYKFSTIPVKISAGSFVEINNLIVKFTSKCKILSVSKTILENKSGGL